jgi:REP element-mobilizing transposase RayT
VNFKYRIHVRNKDTLKLLKKSIQNARSHGLRVLQYSFQHNHVHLILEADANAILTKGMRSLTITFAKGLNKGRVQIERYHLHVLKTAKEVKHALHYVLFNQQKHESGICSTIDDYSSVLSLENGLNLVRKFAKEKLMTLKIQFGEMWRSDEGSYLYQRGLSQLSS